MRACLLLFLLLPLVSRAEPPLPRPQPVRPVQTRPGLPGEEQRQFSRQIVSMSSQVSELYVRPIPRADVLCAALTGLYEHARLPVPRNLLARIRKADAEDRQRTPATPPGWPVPPPDDSPLVRLVEQVRDEVSSKSSLEGESSLLVCCKSMTRVLDSHSIVSSAAEERSRIGLDALCDSVGVELEEITGSGPLRIRTVLPGSPAQRAGMRPEDEIVSLNGRRIHGAPPPVLMAQLQAYPVMVMPGTPSAPERVTFEATYRHPGSRHTQTVKLKRERFQPEMVLGVCRDENNGWRYWADARHTMAHIRLANLGKGATDELFTVLSELRRQGMQGLVLDLRWCPGGLLVEATTCAGLFLGQCEVATLQTRNNQTVHRSTADSNKLLDFPIVLLVNSETSGGAELVAAALQDHHRALVAGQRTRGKGSVQSSLYLGLPGWGLKLTTGTLLRPSGKSLHRFPDSKLLDSWGVQPSPDLELRISADLSASLKRGWNEQTLRPGRSKERLPLDDPSIDPQLQAAIQALAGELKLTPKKEKATHDHDDTARGEAKPNQG